jgi:hypothetical protein
VGSERGRDRVDFNAQPGRTGRLGGIVLDENHVRRPGIVRQQQHIGRFGESRGNRGTGLGE